MVVHQHPKFNPLIKESGMSDFLDTTSWAVTEFGDADLGTLYVTTGGGHLFRVRDSGRRGWLLYPRA